jgi:hypothetical protein
VSQYFIISWRLSLCNKEKPLLTLFLLYREPSRRRVGYALFQRHLYNGRDLLLRRRGLLYHGRHNIDPWQRNRYCHCWHFRTINEHDNFRNYLSSFHKYPSSFHYR